MRTERESNDCFDFRRHDTVQSLADTLSVLIFMIESDAGRLPHVNSSPFKEMLHEKTEPQLHGHTIGLGDHEKDLANGNEEETLLLQLGI